MCSISSSLYVYTPPVGAATAALGEPIAAAAQAIMLSTTDTDSDSAQTATLAVTAVPVVATNADESARATYNALASASTSNVRGTSVNTSA